MSTELCQDTVEILTQHLSDLIANSSAPELPAEFAGNEAIVKLHNRILELRVIVSDFAKGNLAYTIAMRGFVAGGLKALQSNLRHLTWQAQQVERGDFSQQVQFLGDFSLAFNNMIARLATIMNTLKEKEEALTLLTESLQKEVELRTAAVHALKLSEAKFKYLAEHDSLTGTLNRRSFYNMATSELQSANLANRPCCIALLDVDRFKEFNDTHGHPEGDLAIQHVVKVSQSILRQSDMLGRYGGEEFIIFCEGAELEQGIAVAERIRKAIEDAPVTISNGHQISVTVSIGVVAVLPEWYDPTQAGRLFQHYIACADAALYAAKKTGRNRVVHAPVAKPILKSHTLEEA